MPVKLAQGDTIGNIAKAFGTTPDKIIDENGNIITGNRDTGSFVMVPYSQSFFLVIQHIQFNQEMTGIKFPREPGFLWKN